MRSTFRMAVETAVQAAIVGREGRVVADPAAVVVEAVAVDAAVLVVDRAADASSIE